MTIIRKIVGSIYLEPYQLCQKVSPLHTRFVHASTFHHCKSLCVQLQPGPKIVSVWWPRSMIYTTPTPLLSSPDDLSFSRRLTKVLAAKVLTETLRRVLPGLSQWFNWNVGVRVRERYRLAQPVVELFTSVVCPVSTNVVTPHIYTDFATETSCDVEQAV